MKIRPILFNTPMVRAIREDQKSATRRLIPEEKIKEILTSPCRVKNPDIPDERFISLLCDLRYEKGDVLWVRETWCDPTPDQSGWPILYKADMPMRWDADQTEHGEAVTLWAEDYRWRPSIHMPKEAAREFLLVTDVRAERLHSMTDADYIKEGIRLTARENECKCAWEAPGCREEPCLNRDAFEEGKYMWKFAELWDSTVRPEKMDVYGYAANPWVCTIEFERCEKPKEF